MELWWRRSNNDIGKVSSTKPHKHVISSLPSTLAMPLAPFCIALHCFAGNFERVLGEPKLGSNRNHNYEEQAMVPQGSSGNQAGQYHGTSHRSYCKSKNPLRQSLIGEKHTRARSSMPGIWEWIDLEATVWVYLYIDGNMGARAFVPQPGRYPRTGEDLF